jgi:thiol-disulfide isomerase/thioredoxin
MGFRHTSLMAAAVLAAAGMTFAQERGTEKPAKQPAAKEKETTSSKKLAVGDKAPPLTVEEWVKGEPVTGFEKGKVYVVEFWATWCGPCINQMPHLSSLQKEYKDRVTIIGMTSKDSRGNTLEAVEDMVKAKGDGMGYTVAWDEDRATNEAYMKASGQQGIPCSFLVDQNGTIAYIGHPMWLDIPLEQVVKGTWDAEKGSAELKKAQGDFQKIYATMQSDPEQALKDLESFEKSYPKAAAMTEDLKYGLLVKANDPRASEMGRKLVDKAIKDRNAMKLNEVAWGIVDPEGDVENKDLELAMKAATKAAEFTNEKDGAILDTLARVHFLKGDVDKAIELQKKALENAGPMRDQLEPALEEYQAAKEKGKK